MSTREARKKASEVGVQKIPPPLMRLLRMMSQIIPSQSSYTRCTSLKKEFKMGGQAFADRASADC